MHRNDLISCHDCGLLHRRHPLGRREKARCVRCGSVLYRGSPPNLDRIAAITLGAVIVFLIAQFFPIVQLDVNGYTTSATLLGAIRVLWQEQMQVVAVNVLLFTIVFPAIELGALLYVTLALRAGYRPPGFHRLLRAVRKARQWGMTEVLMIGILITIIKMTSLAQVIAQPGLFAFGALTLLLTVVVSFDPRALWIIGDRVDAPAAEATALPADSPMRCAALAGGAHPLACHACGLVAADKGAHGPGQRQHCARCGSTLHRRLPDSIGRTWALLLGAAILYIPANLLPVMHTRSLFGKEDDTIISGVVYFWNSGSPALAAIIFIASIVVPVAKLGALALLAYTSQRGSRWRPRQRTVLYRMVEFVGRWSMLDIFVITLTVALVRFSSLAVITAGPGALAFCAVVVLTMLASMQFDPRLIWDPVQKSGENHA
ncbi:paraquat-inducible protein A [Massilia sp. Root351]|jgi:paraquat-inducible protein A|uniref:paraquat-inducible protein A n=1 Tax=Massilia sp. Root351 TaxID=1736522 RepID=UPI00070B710E|nr:paraquat-inducible protein A [Massilia sp. Root351]KQV91227.1 paraquat-inducible protein A [Massilia sp. Root351]